MYFFLEMLSEATPRIGCTRLSLCLRQECTMDYLGNYPTAKSCGEREVSRFWHADILISRTK